jgi:hypothetical protein
MNAGQKRMRIAVLWVAAAVTYSFGMLMYLLVLPDALEEALAGEMEGMALDGFAGYWMATAVFLLMVMAILTLLVDNRATRWANVGVGLFYGAFTAFEMVGQLADGGFSAAVLLYLMLAGIVFLIAGLSFAELRTPTPQPSAAAPETSEHREKAPA